MHCLKKVNSFFVMLMMDVRKKAQKMGARLAIVCLTRGCVAVVFHKFHVYEHLFYKFWKLQFQVWCMAGSIQSFSNPNHSTLFDSSP